MHGGSQWDTHEGPVVILLLRIHLLTVVLPQVCLSQTSVHLVEDLALRSFLWAHKANNEALLNTKSQDTLNVCADDFEMHKTDNAVLEQISAHLVDVLTLVFKLLFQGDELTTFSFPCWSVVDERLGNNTYFAQSLDHIVHLGLMANCVIHLVVLAVINARLSQAGHHRARHTLFLVGCESLFALSFQELFSLEEELESLISFQSLYVFRVSRGCNSLSVCHEFLMLFLPALKLIHLLLVLILLLDHATLLLLLTRCSCVGSGVSLFPQFLLCKVKLFVVEHNLVEPVLGLLSDALLLCIVLHCVVLLH